MTTLATRSGRVALTGRPNSGKSTLLNFLVGEKISIVTGKPQTTRNLIRGIVTRPEGQIVFVDTPGIHKPMHRMNSLMMQSVRDAMNDAEVLTLVADASQPFGRGDEFALEVIQPLQIPKLLLLNKVDKIRKPDLLPQIDRYSKRDQFDEIIPISARTGENLDVFLKAVFARLPEAPPAYPEDQLSDRTQRSLAADIVREKIIEATGQELPYAVAVTVEHYEEGDGIDRIFATIHVDRESQKGIIIGKGGHRLKAIGSAARLDLEKLIGQRVYLEIRVKTSEGWRDDDQELRKLGLGE